MIDLAPTNPYGLNLATPLIAAAGCLGYGNEVARTLGLAGSQASHGLGAIITRTTTLHPQRTRPLPALLETPAGLLYSGMEHNPGLRFMLNRYAAAWAGWNCPLIVSIGGTSPAELAETAGHLEGVEGIAAIEIPLRLCGAYQPNEASRLITAVRAATLLPLVVKLPYQISDPVDLVAAVIEAGADVLALSDGLPAYAPGPDGVATSGLLCGPAIAPLALATLIEIGATCGIPIIAGGGVSSAADARALIAAGASAVTLGSLLLIDPWAAARIAAALQEP